MDKRIIRRLVRRLVLLAPLAPCPLPLALAACSDGEQLITASWSAPDSTIGNGRMRLPATAEWCAGGGRLVVRGIAGDSGAAILIRTAALEAGEFAAGDTTAARTPGAVVALRVVRSPKLVQLSSDSGLVELTRADDEVAGAWMAWFRQPDDRATFQARGRFAASVVATDSASCVVN